MRYSAFRAVAVCLPLFPVAFGAVHAQTPSPTVRTVSTCPGGVGNRIMRAGVGATLGAWVGFVAAKIKLSDWNDASRSQNARHIRLEATLSGAAIGAALGAVRIHHSCYDTPIPPSPNVQQTLRRPITQEEILQSGVTTNVYDLIYSLRRNWLNVRGIDTFSEAPRTVETANGQEVTIPGEPQLIIYLDNAKLGTLSKLRELAVPGVVEIRYYDGPQATYRWGAGHSHGAIQVLTVSDGER